MSIPPPIMVGSANRHRRDNHPLHLLKQEMKNEDVAAAAQDYEY